MHVSLLCFWVPLGTLVAVHSTLASRPVDRLLPRPRYYDDIPDDIEYETVQLVAKVGAPGPADGVQLMWAQQAHLPGPPDELTEHSPPTLTCFSCLRAWLHSVLCLPSRMPCPGSYLAWLTLSPMHRRCCLRPRQSMRWRRSPAATGGTTPTSTLPSTAHMVGGAGGGLGLWRWMPAGRAGQLSGMLALGMLVGGGD